MKTLSLNEMSTIEGGMDWYKFFQGACIGAETAAGLTGAGILISAGIFGVCTIGFGTYEVFFSN
jgi:bacteriocin-like protein